MPGGRPTTYSQELAETICDLIADGVPLVKICERDDMPARSTVRLWRSVNQEFSAMYEHAREEFAHSLADELLKISDEVRIGAKVKTTEHGEETITGDMVERARLQVDTRKWLASKILPKKYGDKVDVTTNGKDLIPPPINLNR